MLATFQWWRRLRGGRWARVSGYVWGIRWVRVSDVCVERVDEDWRFSPIPLAASEKAIRIKHQDILYKVCNLVDQARGDHGSSRCIVEDVAPRLAILLQPPAAPEREPLKGFPMSEAELAATAALIAKVGIAAPSPGKQPCLLGLTEREWWHICTVLHRAAADRAPVAQPPEEGM